MAHKASAACQLGGSSTFRRLALSNTLVKHLSGRSLRSVKKFRIVFSRKHDRRTSTLSKAGEHSLSDDGCARLGHDCNRPASTAVGTSEALD
jgi:hypothetical protein